MKHLDIRHFVFALFFVPAWAISGALDTGYLAPSAATQGLGGAHAALGSDSGDFILNPAVLARQQSLHLDMQTGSLFGGSEWLLGATAVIPAKEALVGAVSSQRLWTDQSQNFQQLWLASVALPLREEGESAMGLTLKYFDSNYGDPGRCLGLDLGLLHRINFGKATLALGASILDVDSVLEHQSGIEERIPQVIKLSLGLEWGKDLSFGLDNDFVNAGSAVTTDRQYTLHLGAEESFWHDQVIARLGYVSLSGLDNPDPFGGSSGRPTFGLGLRYEHFHVDYAFLPSSGGVGASHRLGFAYDFSKKNQVFEEPTASPKNLKPLKIERALRGDKMVWLAWQDPQVHEDTYYVILMSYRPDDYYNRLAQTGGGQRSFELRGLENGTTYYFKVSSMDASGHNLESTLSAAVKLAPEAPKGKVSELLGKARNALEIGQIGLAMELAEQARLAEPGRADTELLIQRLERMNPGGKP
jgi:hypothetical protein